jgi:hypothetical protein
MTERKHLETVSRDPRPSGYSGSYTREGNYYRNIHTGKFYTESGMKEAIDTDRYERMFG